MSPRIERLLYWLPRILAIVFAAFVSLFALDVFGAGYSLGETIQALLIHLIPTYAILIALIIAWRWEWAGAILFLALAVAYPLMFGTQFHWSVYVTMMTPPLLVAALFLLSWRYRTRRSQP
jgi:hypothetical protein